MHTQSNKAYLANLEASAISNTDVAWNESYMVTWLYSQMDNAYRLGTVVYSKLNKCTWSKFLLALHTNYLQLHHQHQAGPDHPEIASSSPGYNYTCTMQLFTKKRM